MNSTVLAPSRTLIEERTLTLRSGLVYPLLNLPGYKQDGHTILPYFPLIPCIEEAEARPLQLTFYLKKRPDIQQDSIRPLLEKGLFRCRLKFGMPEEAGRQFKRKFKAEPKAVFIRQAALSLYHRGESRVLSSCTASGTTPVFSFRATLTPAHCDSLYDAMLNQASDLHLSGNISFAHPQLPEENITLEIACPLRRIFQLYEHLHPQTRFLSLIRYRYFDETTGNYEDLPEKLSFRSRRTRAAAPQALSLVKSGRSAESLFRALKPASYIAHHLINSQAATQLQGTSLYRIEDLLVERPQANAMRSLPVVEDAAAALWQDRKENHKRWYAPDFALVNPAAAQAAEESPFYFLFRNTGLDAGGNPVLEGEIRLTLVKGKTQDTQHAIAAAGADAHEVALSSASYQLQIPFRKATGGNDVTSIPASEISEEGDHVQLVFRLTNEWVRVCYAAMSIRDVQQKQAVQLLVYYTFEGYAPLKKQELFLHAGYKISALPFVKKQRQNTRQPYFHAVQKKLVYPAGELTFHDTPKKKNRKEKARPLANHLMTVHKINHTLTASPALTPAVNTAILDKIVQQQQYGIQTFGKRVAVDVFYPCEHYGSFYLEETEEQTLAIGCKQPYRLGQIEFRLYQELTELANQYHQVFRSTQTPHRFMVVPRIFRITRFSAETEEKAYRPCIFLYSTIDIENLENSRCVIDATLEPDLPVYIRENLQQRLRDYTSYEPMLEYIAEVSSDASFSWSVPSGITTDLQTMVAGNSLRLSMSAGIEGILTLQAMLRNGSLNGQASFRLADGSTFSIQLQPDLSMITGPWKEGPVEVSVEQQQVSFTNRIQQTVHLTQARLRLADGSSAAISIQHSLAASETYTAPLEEDAVEIYPFYTIEPGNHSLEEIRSFIEDIECQLIFVTNVDFDSQQIANIQVKCRLLHTAREYETVLTKDNMSEELMMLMPLTDYMSSRTIEFSTAVTMSASGQVVTTDWRNWPLAQFGNIINLTSDLIFPS